MRKIYLAVTIILLLILAGNAMADPVKTVESWISTIFKDGDLKQAFSLLATEDQTFIRENVPEVYGLFMGEIGEELGEFGVIASALKQVVLATLGKLVKFEFKAGDKVANGQEVHYSAIIPFDIDFFIKLKGWIEQKEQEFEGEAEEEEDLIGKIAAIIQEFSDMLDNISYKTSIALNDYVTVVKENGEERILLSLRDVQDKIKLLED